MANTARLEALGKLNTYVQRAQTQIAGGEQTVEMGAETGNTPLAPHLTDSPFGPVNPAVAERAEVSQRLDQIDAQKKEQQLAERAERSKYAQALRQEKARIAAEREARRQAQAQQDDLEKTVRGVSSMASSAFTIFRSGTAKAKSRVSGLPTPGDIWVPLAVLLVFFLVLFPVNGHTRLMWLWMVITNNARIAGKYQEPQFINLPGINSILPIGNPGNPNATAGPTGGGPAQSNGHISGNYGAFLQDSHSL